MILLGTCTGPLMGGGRPLGGGGVDVRIEWAVTKEEVAPGATTCVGIGEVGGVGMDVEHHVTGVEADNGIGMGGTVVEEVIDGLCGVFGVGS